MFRLLLLALFSTLLWSNTLTVSPKIVALDTSYFSVEANKSTFDTDLSYTHQRLLSCQPALDAVYKVDSNTKLRVIPKERLKSDINYHCNYHKLAFNITTESFQVMDYHYFQGDKLLRITFNDHVDPEQAKTCITLKKKEKLSSTNLSYTITQHNDTTLLLKINEPIAHQSIELTIDKTLSTPHGSQLKESFSASFNDRYATVAKLDDQRKAMSIPEAPRMVALESGEFAIRLFLDDTLEGNAEKHIVIDGINSFRLDKNNYLDYRMKSREKIADNAYYYTDIISSEFQPNSSYNLTLKKGLRTYQELKEDESYNDLKTADRAKGVLFDEGKPYISNAGELGFKSINLDTATLIVERVLDDNLRYFMNFEGAKEKRVHHYTEEILNQTLTLNNPKNEITQQKFSLKDVAKELPYGIYKVTLRYSQGEEERSQSKVLFLSNLGIAVNLAKDQAFVTVLHLDTAEPVKGAKVTLYGKNNRIIGNVKTDKNGVATLNQANLLSAHPKGVVVKHGRDQNFLALNTTINTPTPQTILKERERFKAHIYYQSKLIRPAGKVHALITIKDKDFISASKLPIKVIFQERYGHILEEKVYHTDEFGLIDYTYQLDVEDRTGNYELLVKIGDTVIGRKGLKVEAFVPPKIENHIATNKEHYLSGELIEANITSSYLFGAPAVGLRGTVTLDADTQAFEHTEYKDYSFTNHTLKEKNTQIYLEQREEIKLNEEGKVSIALPTTITQRVPSILDAMIGVTIMDDTTPVSAYKNVTIYPYEAMVGVKLNSREIEKGQELKGTAVLIDPVTGKSVDRELYATIKKVEWHYSYSNGHYQWDEEMTTIDRFPIKSNSNFSRTLNSNGNYVIEVEDRLGRHSASSDFSVWYESYSNIAPNNTLKSVEISFKDKLYQKGDTIEATIKSPILKGELFVTLESDKVLTYQHHSIEKGVAKIELPIDEAINHGAYLHATVYRASDTPSQLIPFRATGYHYIKPDRSAHQIDVKLDVPKETESKSTLNLGIQTDKEAKLLVSVVDTGILQLAQQEKPSLFEYFNQQADKQLAYYDLYDQLTAYLTEGNLIAFGADGGYAQKRKKHLPPDLGDPIKPFMIWSGLFETKKGSSTLGIDIPEFNGKATIVAIAINQNGLGVTTQDVMIKDDIMIKPSSPRYLLSGDKIDLPVRIFNTTKTDQDVTLDSNVSENLALDFPKSTITIPANSSELIPATLTAKTVGKGKLSITGTVGGKLISKTIELPVYSPYALSTKTFKGMINKPTTFTIPKEYSDAKAYVTLSDNLIGSMRDDIQYLIGYPYGCAEQTTSKLLAMHYAAKFLHNDPLIGESQNFIRQGIKKLRNMQNYYGEFSYWEEGGYINAYASLYAAQTLLELQRDGVEIDASLINKVLKMLQSVTTEGGQYLGEYSKFHRLYAAYILAENGKLDESSANMLLEQKLYAKHFIATYYMAAILKMQGKTAKAQELFEGVKLNLEGSYHRNYGDSTGNFESNRRDQLLHFMIKFQYFNKEDKDMTRIQRTLDDLYSTQEKAMALKAISLYFDNYQSNPLDVDLTINGKTQHHAQATTLIVNSVSDPEITLTPKTGAMSYNIELVKHLSKPTKNRLDSSKTLSIQREFINEEGDKVNLNALVQGETIYSKVTLSNLGKLSNVVVSQAIPACLSIINSNIQAGNEKFKNDNITLAYRDIRDDRVLHFLNLPKKQKYDTTTHSTRIVPNQGILYTPLIVTSTGECQLPAVITEAMYDTRIHDYAKESNSIKAVAEAPATLSRHELETQAQQAVKTLYYREMENSDPNAFLPLFGFPVTMYYRTPKATEQDILKDKATYFKKWPIREYTNIQLNTVSIDSSAQEVVMDVTFDYRLGDQKKELKGNSKYTLTLQYHGNKMVITRIVSKK